MRLQGRWVGAVVWCGVLGAGAQAPVVPVDHYGPPVCAVQHGTGGVRPAAARMSAAKAVEIAEAAAADPSNIVAAEPVENFALTRYRLADYGDCVGSGGCYWADLDAQFKRAEGALDRELAVHRRGGAKLAIVMDIDETTLSSYCEMQREDFGYVGPMFNGWVVSADAAVGIPGALRLFNKAKAAGVAVFFLTGRPDTQTAATAANLEAAGFHGWTGLFLRNAEERGMDTTAYKSGRRASVTAQGYRLLLNVGDQWSDLNGSPRAEISVKLPNPFYFLP